MNIDSFVQTNWGKRQRNCQGQIKKILRKEAKFYALPTGEDTTYKSKNCFRLKNLLSWIWPFPDHPRFCRLNKGKLEMVDIAGWDGQERFYFCDLSQMSAMVSDHSGHTKPKFAPSSTATLAQFLLRSLEKCPNSFLSVAFCILNQNGTWFFIVLGQYVNKSICIC